MALETEERAVEQESSRLAVPLCEKYKLATGAYTTKQRQQPQSTAMNSEYTVNYNQHL